MGNFICSALAKLGACEMISGDGLLVTEAQNWDQVFRGFGMKKYLKIFIIYFLALFMYGCDYKIFSTDEPYFEDDNPHAIPLFGERAWVSLINIYGATNPDGKPNVAEFMEFNLKPGHAVTYESEQYDDVMFISSSADGILDDEGYYASYILQATDKQQAKTFYVTVAYRYSQNKEVLFSDVKHLYDLRHIGRELEMAIARDTFDIEKMDAYLYGRMPVRISDYDIRVADMYGRELKKYMKAGIPVSAHSIYFTQMRDTTFAMANNQLEKNRAVEAEKEQFRRWGNDIRRDLFEARILPKCLALSGAGAAQKKLADRMTESLGIKSDPQNFQRGMRASVDGQECVVQAFAIAPETHVFLGKFDFTGCGEGVCVAKYMLSCRVGRIESNCGEYEWEKARVAIEGNKARFIELVN
ncbi:hypothetical protein [Maritalea sp. S77]|uniref:hypothetical protein n=1 Tax=Maritalea sp. S77 TaxID=3415125 RepID=UPI003C7DB340